VDPDLCLPVRGFFYASDGLGFQGLTFLHQFLHTFRVGIGYFRESLEITRLSGRGWSQALRLSGIF
jgi:hypothetical protein